MLRSHLSHLFAIFITIALVVVVPESPPSHHVGCTTHPYEPADLQAKAEGCRRRSQAFEEEGRCVESESPSPPWPDFSERGVLRNLSTMNRIVYVL